MTRSPTIAEKDLQNILEVVWRETKVPGIGLALSVGGRRLTAAVGSAALNRAHALSERSRFEFSCLMKLINSLVALELASRSRFDLDAPLARWLTELDVEQYGPITARHLMTHTSGYHGVDISEGAVRWAYSWDKLVAHLNQHARFFPPGCVFNYEHTEHVLLAELILRQTGRRAAQWASELIFDGSGIEPRRPSPAMREGDAFVAHHVFSAPRGGFVPASLPSFSAFWEPSLPDSTVTLTDVVAIGELVQSAHRGGASVGISASALQDLCRCEIRLPKQVSSGSHHERIPLGFGTAFAQYGANLLGHNASASGQTMGLRLDLERNVVIAVAVNAYVPHARDSVIERVLGKLAGDAEADRGEVHEGFTFEQLAGKFSSRQLLGRYVGSYFGSIDVSADEAELHLDLGPESRAGRPRVSVLTSDGDRFRLHSPVPALVGFFQDPSDGEPVLAMGVHSYKKQRS